MYDTPRTVDQLLTQLADQPTRIGALTEGLSEAQLHAAPGPGEWSLNDVLAHLRSCGDVWGGCIRSILDEDRPTIKAINPTTWVKRTDYREIDFRPSFRAFQQQRANLLAALKALPPESWSREATVKGAGRTITRTVHSYTEWLANHERSHVKHIVRMVSAMQG
jgi:uncharacterized damage-inducible protein DinB